MPPKPQTTWLTPPYAPNGQDHLGARILNERIYATLLPGITNVTDRARYLSFYPWLLAAHERRVATSTMPPASTPSATLRCCSA